MTALLPEFLTSTVHSRKIAVLFFLIYFHVLPKEVNFPNILMETTKRVENKGNQEHAIL